MSNRTVTQIAKDILIVLTLCLVCLVIAYTLAFLLNRITFAILGYEASNKPTPSFLFTVLLIWGFLLLAIKYYSGVLHWFQMEFTRKEKIVRGTILTLFVLAVLIGCGALAGFFTSILYFTAGYEVPAEPSFPSHTVTWVIWGLLLFLVRSYLKYGNFAKHIDAFSAIIRVLEDIAKGNYKARLEDSLKGSESYGQLVRSVNSMAADLEQLERMRQEFISNVSHELQSPLASIRGFAQVLQQDDTLGIEERNHYISIIEAESTRLSKLSDHLLQLAILESENMSLQPKPYRLDQQIRDLILACEPQWRAKRITMEASMAPVTYLADRDRMSQVWINLLSNSIKFTPEDGKIEVQLHASGGTIEVSLTDSGIGIEQEEQQRIFERFYKADKSRDRSIKGSGLGLSIVSKIVELHGGHICVRSQPGEGTTFTVTLPNLEG